MSFLDSFLGDAAPHKGVTQLPYVRPLEAGDYVAAVPLLVEAIGRDDAIAMGLYAALNALGRGVERNPEDACAWFRQAAVRNHVASQAALGMCLAGGLGIKQDNKEAAYWLHRAGKAGNRQAIEVLSSLAFKDQSIIGEHFTDDELHRMVLATRRFSTQQPAPPMLH